MIEAGNIPTFLDLLLNESHSSYADLEAVLVSGGSPDTSTENGDTALMLVCDEYFNPVLVRLLLKYGASVNMRDEQGRTALTRFLATSEVSDCVYSEENQNELLDSEDVAAQQFVEIFHILLEYGADVNVRDDYGRTPLIVVAENHNYFFFAQELLRRGADASAQDNEGRTALMTAAGRVLSNTAPYSFHNGALVDMLIEQSSPVAVTDADGSAPLIAALESGNSEAARRLIAHGWYTMLPEKYSHLEPVFSTVVGDLDRLRRAVIDKTHTGAPAKNGRTPLMWAAELGNVDAVRLLLESGAEIDSADSAGWTALFFAVVAKQVEVTRLLLDHGANQEHKNGEDQSVLELALNLSKSFLSNEFRDVCIILWKYGADISRVSTEDVSCAGIKEMLRPMWLAGMRIGPRQAARVGELGLLHELLEHGRANDEDEHYYNDALGVAIYSGQTEAVALMLSFGYDVNWGDYINGVTPLIRAALLGDETLVHALLKAGADPHVESAYGDTAISVATENGHPNVVRIIEEWIGTHRND